MNARWGSWSREGLYFVYMPLVCKLGKVIIFLRRRCLEICSNCPRRHLTRDLAAQQYLSLAYSFAYYAE
jgi:hypothetical protein